MKITRLGDRNRKIIFSCWVCKIRRANVTLKMSFLVKKGYEIIERALLDFVYTLLTKVCWPAYRRVTTSQKKIDEKFISRVNVDHKLLVFGSHYRKMDFLLWLKQLGR